MSAQREPALQGAPVEVPARVDPRLEPDALWRWYLRRGLVDEAWRVFERRMTDLPVALLLAVGAETGWTAIVTRRAHRLSHVCGERGQPVCGAVVPRRGSTMRLVRSDVYDPELGADDVPADPEPLPACSLCLAVLRRRRARAQRGGAGRVAGRIDPPRHE